MPDFRDLKSPQRRTPRWSFLMAMEEAEHAPLPDKLCELAINQMSITLATS